MLGVNRSAAVSVKRTLLTFPTKELMGTLTQCYRLRPCELKKGLKGRVDLFVYQINFE